MATLNGKQQRVINAMQPMLKTAPWVLRVTERKDYTGAILEVCERYDTGNDIQCEFCFKRSCLCGYCISK